MKYLIILITVFFSQLSQATYFTNFDEAQKVALATNKFIVLDFTGSWCAPTTKPMGLCTLNLGDQNKVFQQYVIVQVDQQTIQYYFKNFDFKISPEIFIVDANAKYIHNFSGFLDEASMKIELEKFALSTEFLSLDLINYYKNNNYSNSLKIYQKYLDYSLMVDNSIKDNFINLANIYFENASERLIKMDLDYEEKNQKLNLFMLYHYVYTMNFEKAQKKVDKFNLKEIKEGNLYIYYFLKYIIAKGLQKVTFSEIENEVAQLDGFDYFKDKADFILSKK